MARIERLEAELQELRAAVGAPIEPPPTTGDRPHNSIVEPPADAEPHSDTEPPAGATSRRRALGALAAGAVGVVAAAVESHPAAAANGDPVYLANVNTSTAPTVVDSTLSSYSNASFETAALTANAIGRGYGIDAEGGWGNALFRASGSAPSAASARKAGILWVDGGGNWWLSVGVNQWRQIAGPNFTPGAGSSGSFTPLAVPKRVYDTRKSEDAPGFKSEFAPNETREIDLTAAGSGVPKSAKAVQISYVVIHPPNPGYAVAWPSGPKPDTSQVNYPGGRSDVRGATIVIGAVNGKIFINSLGGGDIAVDVYGYFS